MKKITKEELFVQCYIMLLPAKQTKLHVFSIPLEKNGEYMELGLFSRHIKLYQPCHVICHVMCHVICPHAGLQMCTLVICLWPMCWSWALRWPALVTAPRLATRHHSPCLTRFVCSTQW